MIFPLLISNLRICLYMILKLRILKHFFVCQCSYYAIPLFSLYGDAKLRNLSLKKCLVSLTYVNNFFPESRGDIKKGETCLNVLKLLIKEYQLLEREQLFALQRFLAHKLSTKTKQFVNVHLVKRTRKFLTTCEACNDPVSKSASSDEREPNEIEFVKVFEVSDNFGADH